MSEMPYDEDVWRAADEIAQRHTRRGWFEAEASALVRAIRLRTSIANAITAERRRGDAELAAWRAAFPEHRMPDVEARRKALREGRDG